MIGDHRTLWPIRPKPLEGEILSSWLSRIGAAHGLSLHQFVKLLVPNGARPVTDLDQIGMPAFFEAVAERSGIDTNMVWSLGLLSDEGRIFLGDLDNDLDWMTPLQHFDIPRRYQAQPFCPSCLAEDPIPYYRKHWRYAFNVVCPRHGLLTDSCPHCGASYLYVGVDRRNSTDLPSGVIGECRMCHKRFTAASTPHPDNIDLSAVGIAQSKIENALEDGWALLDEGPPINVCLYLRGLRLLTNIFSNNDVAQNAVGWLRSKSDLRPPDWPRLTSMGTVEGKPVWTRAWILVMTSWLVEEWPRRFVAMTESLRLKPSVVLAAKRGCPSWIVHPDLESFFSSRPTRSPEELEAARRLIASKRKWAPNNAEVAAFMRTGVVPDIKLIGKTITPAVKEKIRRTDAELGRVHQVRAVIRAANKNRPRELYKAEVTLPGISTKEALADALPALSDWARSRKDGSTE